MMLVSRNSDPTGDTSRTATAYPSEGQASVQVLVSVHVAQYLVFREAIALFVLLTTPLVSSHSSFSKYVRGEMFHVVVS
jgi:hypothetical protein